MQKDISSQERKLAALIGQSTSGNLEEARTAAFLAIKLMRKMGLLPESLLKLATLQEMLKAKKKAPKGKAAITKMARSGGKARAAALTPEQRSEIARRAVKTRWANKKKLLKEARKA